MADFFTPANLLQGRGSAESPGTGAAVGDVPILNLLGNSGVDYMLRLADITNLDFIVGMVGICCLDFII